MHLGDNVREFLKKYKPFVDTNKKRIYEWQDELGVKFRLVIGDELDKAPATLDRMRNASALSNDRIITFYSNRNLKNDTIENADKILKDDKKGILFTKEFIIKKTQNKQERIFVSVAKDYNGEWIFTSHSFRDKNNIQNKLKNGVVIYKKIA